MSFLDWCLARRIGIDKVKSERMPMSVSGCESCKIGSISRNWSAWHAHVLRWQEVNHEISICYRVVGGRWRVERL